MLIAKVAKEHGYEKLKEEQLLAIDEFVSGKVVFVSLLTGFVKSLIYGLLPAVYDRVRGYTMPTSVATVVSPLASYYQTCGCEVMIFTPTLLRGRNQPRIGNLPDPLPAPDSLRRGIMGGCFHVTAESNGGRPKCCIRKLVVFASQNAPKNTEHGYSGLAPLYIGLLNEGHYLITCP